MPRAKKSNWSVPVTDGGIGGDFDARYYFEKLHGRATYESDYGELGVLKAVLDLAENDLGHPYWRLDAIQWITARLNDGEDWNVTAFEYICEAMGLSPSATRTRLLKKAEELRDVETKRVRHDHRGRGRILQSVDS